MREKTLRLRHKSVRKILMAKTVKIEAIFDRYKVVLAYLFGSQVKENITPVSDVDIAVLFSKEVSSDEYSDRQVKLISEFMKVFSRNDVDILVLNMAPPLIRYKASLGKIIFRASEKERLNFELRAFRDYLDTKKLREVQWRVLERKLRAI